MKLLVTSALDGAVTKWNKLQQPFGNKSHPCKCSFCLMYIIKRCFIIDHGRSKLTAIYKDFLRSQCREYLLNGSKQLYMQKSNRSRHTMNQRLVSELFRLATRRSCMVDGERQSWLLISLSSLIDSRHRRVSALRVFRQHQQPPRAIANVHGRGL